MMFKNVSDEQVQSEIKQLQSEIKRRKEERKDVPLWVRQPLWWKAIDLFTDFELALCLCLISPIWVPFWMTHRVYQWRQKELQKEAQEKGIDWKKYHG